MPTILAFNGIQVGGRLHSFEVTVVIKYVKNYKVY